MSGELAEVVVDRRSNGRTVVSVRGEVDMSNVGTVQRDVLAAADGSQTLIVDLRELDFLDSQGLRMLYDVVGARPDGSVCIVAPQGSVAGQLLAIAGMRDVVPVLDTEPPEEPAPARG